MEKTFKNLIIKCDGENGNINIIVDGEDYAKTCTHLVFNAGFEDGCIKYRLNLMKCELANHLVFKPECYKNSNEGVI
jgi:hypothetical protein